VRAVNRSLWLFCVALVAGRCAHAADRLEVRQGFATSRFTGTLLMRGESGSLGSIEFGARASVIRATPVGSAPREGAADYAIEVIPAHDNVAGFHGEHCRLDSAHADHDTGSARLVLTCPP
jgi:hypothetical protein